MILITGGTGFIGRSLVARLAASGKEVRCLLRPSRHSPRLPRGVAVQAAVSRLDDSRGLRAALAEIEAVIHLAGAEWLSQRGDLFHVDVAGTRAMVEAAQQAGVRHLVYLSHLGADRGAAYTLQKAKGIAEEFIRKSGLEYTIVQSAIVFGEEDRFTNAVAVALKSLPFFFPLPSGARTLIQPIWVEDLARCLALCLDEPALRNQTLSLGGPEPHTLESVVRGIMDRVGARRLLMPVRAPYLRFLGWWLDGMLPRSPFSSRWLDYLAVNRTAELVSVQRFFGFKPQRMEESLDYLEGRRWSRELVRFVLARGS